MIELGIEGIDKLVDKHFHKLPDKYIDPHTYSPCRWYRHGEESGESENVLRADYEDTTRKIKGERNSAAIRGDIAYSPEREESYNVRQRQRTSLPPAPSAPDSSRGYEYVVPPPTSNLGVQDNRRRERRNGLVRRSSSQPGAFRLSDRGKTKEDREKERKRRRESFSDERRRDIVGAGRGNGNGGGQNKTEKVVLTLLGAAVGGLAVRAIIDSIDRKSGTRDDMRSGGRPRSSGDEKRAVKERGRR